MARQRKTIRTNVELLQTVQTRILDLLDRKNGEWSGSMSDLDYAITSGLRKNATRDWPTTPSVLRRVVNSVVNRLRSRGVSVRFARVGHERKRMVEFSRN